MKNDEIGTYLVWDRNLPNPFLQILLEYFLLELGSHWHGLDWSSSRSTVCGDDQRTGTKKYEGISQAQ